MSEEKNTRAKKNSNTVVIIGIVIGVILLLLGGGGSFFSKPKESTDVSAEVKEYDEIKYEEEVVKKIEEICSQVKDSYLAKWDMAHISTLAITVAIFSLLPLQVQARVWVL